MIVWKNPEKYKSYFIGDWYVSGDSAYKEVESSLVPRTLILMM